MPISPPPPAPPTPPRPQPVHLIQSPLRLAVLERDWRWGAMSAEAEASFKRRMHADCQACSHAKLDWSRDVLTQRALIRCDCTVAACKKAGWSIRGPMTMRVLKERSKPSGLTDADVRVMTISTDKIAAGDLTLKDARLRIWTDESEDFAIPFDDPPALPVLNPDVPLAVEGATVGAW